MHGLRCGPGGFGVDAGHRGHTCPVNEPGREEWEG